MRKRFFTMIMASAAVLSFVLSGCGSGGGTSQSNPSSVQGVAASGAAVVGVVTLEDAAVPPHALTTTSAADGSFSFKTDGLTQPFILSVAWTDASGLNQLYSFGAGPGIANINPFSNAVFASSAGSSNPAALFAAPNTAMFGEMSSRHTSVSDSLKSKLAPLFTRYGTAKDPITDDYHADHTGLDAMFDDVTITISNGMIIVTNKQTGAVIFTAPINDIPSGIFDDNNMPVPGSTPPPPPPATVTLAQVTATCTACHGLTVNGTVLKSGGYTVTGRTSSAWLTTVNNMMGQGASLASGTTAQNYADFLANLGSSTPPPTACTYTYAAWGACQSNNTQTRSVLTTSPAGCTGTPATSQVCIYVPPTPGACTSFTYAAWGACQSNNTQTRTVATSSPTGCTGGSPVLSQACTYVPPVTACTSFTYSAWGACQSNSTQTRTVATSSPTGCTGGSPVLSQSCTYTPPPTTLTLAQVTATCTACHGLTDNGTVLKSGGYTVTGRTSSAWLTTVNNMIGQGASLAAGATAQNYADFLANLGSSTPPPTACTYTYAAWGACQSSNTQTRSVLTTSPAGCTGTPVTSQACTYVPPVTACTSFTYSVWGACQSNSTQTRTVATSSPTGCTGGSPVLSQACTYVPPVTACTSFTYSAWGACQSNSTQTRTVATSSPTGCTGGSPVLSQACTYTPPSTLTLAQVTASCTACHGLTVNTTVLKSGGYTVSGRTSSAWLTTVNNMMGQGASLASGMTAQNYADFLATLP